MTIELELNSRQYEIEYYCDYDGEDMDYQVFAIYKNRKRQINIDKLSTLNRAFMLDAISNHLFSNSEEQRKQLCAN